MSLTVQNPGTRLDRRKQATRRRLIDAAHELFASGGFRAIKIAAVTELADLGYGTFYVHFRNRDEMVWEVLQATFDGVETVMEAELAGIPSPRREYLSWRFFFENAERNREQTLALFGPGGSAFLARRMQEYLAAAYLKNIASGLYHLPAALADVPPDYAAQFITGAQIRLLEWWLGKPEAYSAEQMARLLFQVIFQQPIPTE